MYFPGKNTGVGILSAGDLLNPRVESTSPASASGFFTTEPTGKPNVILLSHKNKVLPLATTLMNFGGI